MSCSPSTARSSWPFFAATSKVFMYEQLNEEQYSRWAVASAELKRNMF
jgi:hypothetical protein